MAKTRSDEKDVIVQGRDVPATVQTEPARTIERTPAADPAYNPARPGTRKTPIDNPLDGKRANDTVNVVYNPTPGDPEEAEVFGKKMVAGEAVEVPARYADKARGNPTLTVEGEKTFGDDKRGEEKPEEIEETSFEENVAHERAKEYLEGRATYIPNTAPGEAERVARAQQQAAEMQAALESDEADKPRKRGRPAKDPAA